MDVCPPTHFLHSENLGDKRLVQRMQDTDCDVSRGWIHLSFALTYTKAQGRNNAIQVNTTIANTEVNADPLLAFFPM